VHLHTPVLVSTASLHSAPIGSVGPLGSHHLQRFIVPIKGPPQGLTRNMLRGGQLQPPAALALSTTALAPYLSLELSRMAVTAAVAPLSDGSSPPLLIDIPRAARATSSTAGLPKTSSTGGLRASSTVGFGTSSMASTTIARGSCSCAGCRMRQLPGSPRQCGPARQNPGFRLNRLGAASTAASEFLHIWKAGTERHTLRWTMKETTLN